MAVNVIPFSMPAPMEIPSHIVEMLSGMDPDEAVCKGMELLMGIDAADAMVYERIAGDGTLHLHAVRSDDGRSGELEDTLGQESFYGRPLGADARSTAAAAFEKNSPLLIMGESSGDEEEPLPPGLGKAVLGGSDSGNVGFVYVLPLSGAGDRPLGVLTLIRTQKNGPLNHEQPNITEAMRQLLGRLLDRRQPAGSG